MGWQDDPVASFDPKVKPFSSLFKDDKKPAWMSDPVVSQDEIQAPNLEGMSRGDKLLTNIGAGFEDTRHGLMQLNNKMTETRAEPLSGGDFYINPENKMGILTGINKLAGKAAGFLGADVQGAADQARQGDEQIRQQVAENAGALAALDRSDPLASGAGHLIANVAEGALIPAGPIGMGGKALLSAGLGSAAQAGIQYAPDDATRMKNMALGGAMGAAGSALLGATGKTINAIRGRYADARIQTLMDEAARNGVPLTLGDVAGKSSKFLETIDNMLSALPIIGNAGLRTQQAVKATEMLQKLKDDYGRYVGDSPSPVKDALFTQMNAGKAEAAAAFKKVSQTSELLGAVVHPFETQKTAQSILSQIKSDIKNPELQNPEVLKILQPFLDPGAMSFNGARQIRSTLNDQIRTLMKNKVIGSDEARTLGRLSESLDTDLQKFGELGDASLAKDWRSANQIYREKVAPFKDPLLAKAMKADDWDLVLPSLLKDPRKARKMYEAADEPGRQALRYSVLDMAMQNATQKLSSGQEIINPTIFLTQIRKMKGSVGEIFQGQDAKTLQGVTNLLGHLQNVDRFVNTPQTGMGAARQMMTASTIPAAAAAAALGSGGAVAAAVSGAAALRFALGSNAGTRLILAAADPRKDPKKLASIWTGIQLAAERNQAVLNGEQAPED